MRTESLTSHEVARLVQVSPSTVLGWIDKGLLPAYRTPGGHRRVDTIALLRFLREHEMPVPKSLAPVTRLLVIDDEDAFLRTAKRLLRRQIPHLEIEVAAGAVDGLLKVGTFRPDAVLLDAYMPGIDGVEVCRRLHGSPETAHVIVVALTGNPSEEMATNFLDAGAAACLVKPLDTGRLRSVLGLNGGQEASV